MKTIKAILPVAGTGTRLRPHTLTRPKVLLPIAGKPMLQHIVDELIPYDIDEYIYIIGHHGKQISEFVTRTYPVTSRFVEQKERLGLGHAISLAKDHIKPGDDLLIILGDTIFELDLSKVIQSNRSLIGIKEVKNPERFGIVQLENETVKRFIEKPTRFVGNLAIVGIYYINNAALLMDALGHIIERGVKTKGEYQLTDALQYMVKEGHDFGVIPIEGWFDCGKPETLLATNRHFLEKHCSEKKDTLPGMTPPCFIGKEVTLTNAAIGPYVSIGDGCTIENSTIKNSIVYDHAFISNASLTDSIIGSYATVKGDALICNIGEYASVEGRKS